jgi:hypothetical protein
LKRVNDFENWRPWANAKRERYMTEYRGRKAIIRNDIPEIPNLFEGDTAVILDEMHEGEEPFTKTKCLVRSLIRNGVKGWVKVSDLIITDETVEWWRTGCMDENDKFRDVNKLLESLEKSSVKSKAYIKFIIGLSTGTLVFSGTLVKEFIKFPQYKSVLVIGWGCLFISMILWVWILPGGDRLQALFESLKGFLTGSPEKIKAILEKKLQEFYIKDWIKKFLPSSLENDERMKDFYKSLETVSLENLKKLFGKLPEVVAQNPTIPILKNLVEEFVKFSYLGKIEQQGSYPPTLIRNLRRTIWQIIYFERVMRYTFFIGMFAILIFSIINLLR